MTVALQGIEFRSGVTMARRGGEHLPIPLLGICIALMPLLRPALPGNSAAVDVFLLAAVLIVLVWARGIGATLHMPYALPMAISIVAGALGALAGHFPGPSSLALGQDIFLLVW